jgi:hypothetical protein
MSETRWKCSLEKILIPHPITRDAMCCLPVNPERFKRRLRFKAEGGCKLRIDLIRANDRP